MGDTPTNVLETVTNTMLRKQFIKKGESHPLIIASPEKIEAEKIDKIRRQYKSHKFYFDNKDSKGLSLINRGEFLEPSGELKNIWDYIGNDKSRYDLLVPDMEKLNTKLDSREISIDQYEIELKKLYDTPKRGGKNVSTRKHKKNKQHKSRKSNTNKQTCRKSIRRRRR
jgi:hypothetical protein